MPFHDITYTRKSYGINSLYIGQFGAFWDRISVPVRSVWIDVCLIQQSKYHYNESNFMTVLYKSHCLARLLWTRHVCLQNLGSCGSVCPDLCGFYFPVYWVLLGLGGHFWIASLREWEGSCSRFLLLRHETYVIHLQSERFGKRVISILTLSATPSDCPTSVRVDHIIFKQYGSDWW